MHHCNKKNLFERKGVWGIHSSRQYLVALGCTGCPEVSKECWRWPGAAGCLDAMRLCLWCGWFGRNGLCPFFSGHCGNLRNSPSAACVPFCSLTAWDRWVQNVMHWSIEMPQRITALYNFKSNTCIINCFCRYAYYPAERRDFLGNNYLLSMMLFPYLTRSLYLESGGLGGGMGEREFFSF